MSIDVERRTAAALETWAATATPSRPSIDELLARAAAPIGGEDVGRRRMRWVAVAAAGVVLAGVGVTVAATRHRPTEPQAPTSITEATAPPSTTSSAPQVERRGLFAPTSIPAGYAVVTADAWVPSPAELPVTDDVWVRRDATGAITDRLTLGAVGGQAAPRGPGPSEPGSPTVHGRLAWTVAAEQRADSPAGVSWTEAGFWVSMASTDPGVDLLALAERSVVGADGVRLPADAIPAGFEPVAPDPGAGPPAETSGRVVLQADDEFRWMMVQNTPDTGGLPLEATLAPGEQLRTVGGRQVAVESSGGVGPIFVRWIEDGSIVQVGSTVGPTLDALVESVQPVDEQTFDVLADTSARRVLDRAVQDAVVFPDGLRASLRGAALDEVGDPGMPDVSLCVEADRVRCGAGPGSWSSDAATGGSIVRQADLLVVVDGHRQRLMWRADPATEVRIVADAATGQSLPYEVIAGEHGVFVRVDVPDGTSDLRMFSWSGDGDRDFGGGGTDEQVGVGRIPLTATVTTDGVDRPEATGWHLPVGLPDGFAVTSAVATAPDLGVHDPISQDFWVRRGADGAVTDWLSVVARRDADGAVSTGEANLVINEQPAVLRTDAAGTTTITWFEGDQRVTVTSTIDPLELASATEFVAVQPDGGGASLVTPARFEHVDRGDAIVAANPLAVTTTLTVRHGTSDVEIVVRPNVDGESFETRPPLGASSDVALGAGVARLTHLTDGTTSVEWFADGFFLQATGRGLDDQDLIAVAATVQPVDRPTFDAAG